MFKITHNSSNPFRHSCRIFFLFSRTFVDAKVKWVRDPYLDEPVQKEKNLKSLLALKTLITSHPSKTLPLPAISTQKTNLNLVATTTVAKFIQNYPSIFQQFIPAKPLSLPHVRLTPQTMAIHIEESRVLKSVEYKKDSAVRLAKLLMLTRGKRLPLLVIEKFQYDLGLPHDFVLSLVPEFPEYFRVCSMKYRDLDVLGLELISWRDDFAVSVLEKNAKRGVQISYTMNFPRGFDLDKRVKIWVVDWQKLPYISPYVDAFHLSPTSDQAEKWTVAVLHELLHLCVAKKTEREILLSFGEFLGFGIRFRQALRHHPGIFYISNKIRTQTVLLREAYINMKEFLVDKHPLVALRYRYIHLMNKNVRQKPPTQIRADRRNESYRKKVRPNVTSFSEHESVDVEKTDIE